MEYVLSYIHNKIMYLSGIEYWSSDIFYKVVMYSE